MAQGFAEQFGVTAPLFTDPSRASYKAVGMKRAFGLGLKSVGRGRRAMDAGFNQGRTQGDPWQQGGVVLFDGAGSVRWSAIDDGAGEQVDLDALTAAIASL